MTPNFYKTSLLLSLLTTAFMAPAAAMDIPTQTITKHITVSRSPESPAAQKIGQDIFDKLNTSLSFLLTTKEVMTSLQKEPVHDGSYVFRPTCDRSNPCWEELSKLDPTMFSYNALQHVLHLIRQNTQLCELAGMNKMLLLSYELVGIDQGMLQFIHLDSGTGIASLGYQLIFPRLLEFVQKDIATVKVFLNHLRNACMDKDIVRLIENSKLFLALVKNPSYFKFIGMKDLFPLQLADSQGARNAQILQGQADLQEEIDNVLIFKKLIFPDGRVTSYQRNTASFARMHLEVVMKALGSHKDTAVKSALDSNLNFIDSWRNFKSVLLENYTAILEIFPKEFSHPRGALSKKTTRTYKEQGDKINQHRLSSMILRQDAKKVAVRLMYDGIQAKDPIPETQKVSTLVSCKSLLNDLGDEKRSVQSLCQDLDQRLANLQKERNVLGLPSDSFFLDYFLEELHKSVFPSWGKKDNVATSVPVKSLPVERNGEPQLSLQKTPQNSSNKRKKRKAAKQVQRANENQQNAVPQNDLIQASVPLNGQVPLDADKGNKGEEVITTSVPQITLEKAVPQIVVEKIVPQITIEKTVPQISVEKTPIQPTSLLETEKKVKFGNDYFKELHAHYQKLKNSQKDQPEDGANLLLTPYECNLYTYLMDNVFNNNNRPSWDGIVHDLGTLGFQGKPNTVGNGSTWVFSVTHKNGLFFADENYRYVTFNVHCLHGKKGNEPIPIPYLKFFQSGFGHMFGLTKEVVEERLRQHNFRQLPRF